LKVTLILDVFMFTDAQCLVAMVQDTQLESSFHTEGIPSWFELIVEDNLIILFQRIWMSYCKQE